MVTYSASMVDLYFIVAWSARDGNGMDTPTGEGVLWNKTTVLQSHISMIHG